MTWGWASTLAAASGCAGTRTAAAVHARQGARRGRRAPPRHHGQAGGRRIRAWPGGRRAPRAGGWDRSHVHSRAGGRASVRGAAAAAPESAPKVPGDAYGTSTAEDGRRAARGNIT